MVIAIRDLEFMGCSVRADTIPLKGVRFMPLLIEEPLVPTAADVALPDPPLCVPKGQPRRTGVKQRALATMASLLNTCLGPREKLAFGILMYHRIADPVRDQPKPTWNVPPRLFEKQLQGLLSRGWQAWPLRQVLSCAARELPIPRKTFVVTFDDGYANNLLHAYPILTKLRVPATVFIATAYLDSKQPLPSDDWPAAGVAGVPSETWRPLTTEECRRLIANGLVELGAHTHTHADFRGRPEALVADLEQNLAVLREQFGIEEPTFALPYGTKCDGYASAALARAAREAGVICCLTSEPNLVRAGDAPFDWGRFAAEDHDTAGTLAGKLGGWHSALRQLGKKAVACQPRCTA
jgi:peptidoglycan/xylan/chitin deacetylase (PgdA/CDA1 family)